MNTNIENTTGPTWDEAKWIWAAGIFEGEGCIVHCPGKWKGGRNGMMRRLALQMTDRDVVERFRKVMGCGKVKTVSRAKLGYKTIYVWYTVKWSNIKRILDKLFPYLCERRTNKALELLNDPPGKPGGRLKTHCLNGHPMIGPGSDIYTWGNVRQCRHCRRDRNGQRPQTETGRGAVVGTVRGSRKVEPGNLF